MKPHYHFRGEYIIKTEWKGRTLIYDVSTVGGGLPVAAGFDKLSQNEKAALEGIVSRLSQKREAKAA